MKVRIVSKGWETFSGNFGPTPFQDGVSVSDLPAFQIARIGAAVMIVDADTGEQVGPAALAQKLADVPAHEPEIVKTLDQTKVDAEKERQRLIDEDNEREAKTAANLAEAQQKAQDAVPIYSRAELEAIASNDGINALREIAKPLNVKGRAIAELVNEILDAQTKLAIA